MENYRDKNTPPTSPKTQKSDKISPSSNPTSPRGLRRFSTKFDKKSQSPSTNKNHGLFSSRANHRHSPEMNSNNDTDYERLGKIISAIQLIYTGVEIFNPADLQKILSHLTAYAESRGREILLKVDAEKKEDSKNILLREWFQEEMEHPLLIYLHIKDDGLLRQFFLAELISSHYDYVLMTVLSIATVIELQTIKTRDTYDTIFRLSGTLAMSLSKKLIDANSRNHTKKLSIQLLNTCQLSEGWPQQFDTEEPNISEEEKKKREISLRILITNIAKFIDGFDFGEDFCRIIKLYFLLLNSNAEILTLLDREKKLSIKRSQIEELITTLSELSSQYDTLNAQLTSSTNLTKHIADELQGTIHEIGQTKASNVSAKLQILKTLSIAHDELKKFDNTHISETNIKEKIDDLSGQSLTKRLQRNLNLEAVQAAEQQKVVRNILNEVHCFRMVAPFTVMLKSEFTEKDSAGHRVSSRIVEALRSSTVSDSNKEIELASILKKSLDSKMSEIISMNLPINLISILHDSIIDFELGLHNPEKIQPQGPKEQTSPHLTTVSKVGSSQYKTQIDEVQFSDNYEDRSNSISVMKK